MKFENFARSFAERTGFTIADSKKICNECIAVFIDTLMSGEEIRLNGFGSFVVIHKEPREIHLFGKPQMSKDKKVIKFSASNALLARLNGFVDDGDEDGGDE